MTDDRADARFCAPPQGDADAAAVALRPGADLEARDDAGRTPLLLAAAADLRRSPGCWSPWAPTRTPSTTSTTPPGW